MKVNGEEIKAMEELTVGMLLEEKNYRRERVAVEINGEIIPKAEYDKYIIGSDDVVEIVSFVGGG